MIDPPRRYCAACVAQTKIGVHGWPHQALRPIGERTFPGMPHTVRETDYSCQNCGGTIIHSTSIQECAWRCVAGTPRDAEPPARRTLARRH